MVNASQWFASATVVSLSNTYHPDNPRGVGPAAKRVAYGAVQNMSFDVLREFWPDISKKLRKHEPKGIQKLEENPRVNKIEQMVIGPVAPPPCPPAPSLPAPPDPH